MRNPSQSSKYVFPGLFLVLFVAFASPVAAESQMTFSIYSFDYDISSPVWVNITGPAGMAISIRVTEASGNIIAGRDTNLDLTGNYSFEWRSSQEGTYNVTVTWATGFTLTKSLRINDAVTSQDITELYGAIFRMENRLKELLAENQKLTQLSVAFSAIAGIAVTIAALYVRNAAPRPKTELERFIVEDLDALIKKRNL